MANRDSNQKKKQAQAPLSPKKTDTPSPKRRGPQKNRFEQIVFRDWCKGCGICSAFCPKNVIGRDDTGAPVIEHPENCIGCRFCELHCPDFAITIKEKKKDKESTGHD